MEDPTSKHAVTLGKRIRARRKAAGLIGADIEKRTGIGPATLSLLENGKQEPSLFQLRALARALRTTVADLLGVRRSSSSPAQP